MRTATQLLKSEQEQKRAKKLLTKLNKKLVKKTTTPNAEAFKAAKESSRGLPKAFCQFMAWVFEDAR